MEEENELQEAQKAESEGQFFVAFNLYARALETALKKGDKETITICKVRIAEMGRKSQSDLKEVSVEQQVSKADLRRDIDPIFKADSLAGIFLNMARSFLLFPRKQAVEAAAKKRMPLTYQICSVSTIAENGHLLDNGDDPMRAWYSLLYNQCQDMTAALYLNPIFDELEKITESEKAFTSESLLKYFTDSPVFPAEQTLVIRVGIERYFEKDYVSALHILIPQFESLFLHISEKVGIDVVSINSRGKGLSTGTRVLSINLLDSEDCQKNWSPDLCEQLKFVLLDPLGYKLRHKIAHGEITEKECTKSHCNLMIYLYLVVLGRVQARTVEMTKSA